MPTPLVKIHAQNLRAWSLTFPFASPGEAVATPRQFDLVNKNRVGERRQLLLTGIEHMPCLQKAWLQKSALRNAFGGSSSRG